MLPPVELILGWVIVWGQIHHHLWI